MDAPPPRPAHTPSRFQIFVKCRSGDGGTLTLEGVASFHKIHQIQRMVAAKKPDE